MKGDEGRGRGEGSTVEHSKTRQSSVELKH